MCPSRNTRRRRRRRDRRRAWATVAEQEQPETGHPGHQRHKCHKSGGPAAAQRIRRPHPAVEGPGDATMGGLHPAMPWPDLTMCNRTLVGRRLDETRPAHKTVVEAQPLERILITVPSHGIHGKPVTPVSTAWPLNPGTGHHPGFRHAIGRATAITTEVLPRVTPEGTTGSLTFGPGPNNNRPSTTRLLLVYSSTRRRD